MLVIRLSRKGRRNRPIYRIVVAEHSRPTDGKFVEVVGTYNSIAADKPLSVKKDRVEYWMSQGAKPSNTVAKLLNKVGFNLEVIKKNKPSKQKTKEEDKKVTEKDTPKEEKKEEVQTEVADQVPAEEAKTEEAPKEEKKKEGDTKEEPKKEEVTEVAPETEENKE